MHIGRFSLPRRGSLSLGEGDEIDLVRFTMQYAPYIRFKTHAVLTLERLSELLEAVANS